MRSMRLPIALFCSLAAFSALPIPSPIPMFRAIAAEAQDSNAVVAARKLQAVPANRTVTLDPLSSEELAVASLAESAKAPSKVPENFRRFDAVVKGQIGDTKTLTLRFAAGAKLLTIKSTPEFKVEQGGSCVEGFSYAANSTCTLLVRSTPQGPGHRLGKLEITNSVDAKPLNVGLGGYGYAPTISFTPSIISTVPGTYPGSKGLFSGATNLAVDGGDNLYIADTGNNRIEYIDSSGTIQSGTENEPGFSLTNPVALAVDGEGSLYYTQPNSYFFNIAQAPAGEVISYSTGSNALCGIGSSCVLEGSNVGPSGTGAMATDPNGTVFLSATFESVMKLVPNPGDFSIYYTLLDDPLAFNSEFPAAPPPLAVDASDTLYSYYNDYVGSGCSITSESYYNAESDISHPVTVTGGLYCGFSGDGGQARGAEIGNLVGQMTFDIAGNLYFSDTSNQRVRRVDGSTGIITTIAGNGATGYSGDNGPATAAALNTPTGIAVDSQGQVYILSNSATTGSAQVVRKVGVVGALNLGSLAVGTASTAQTVQVANTGNEELNFFHIGMSSGNTADFTIDPNTTTCIVGVPLPSGHSCKIGFIFTPAAAGSRSAVVSIADDTIAAANTIQISGTGYTTATLTPASLTFASTSVGVASAAQTATLTNTGSASMTISSIAFSGTGASFYSDTTTCGTTLAAGASCTISVVFTPTAAGSFAATLTVTDNALGGKQTLTLTGTGVQAAQAVLSPTSLTFGTQNVGATGYAQTIKLSNPGTGALGVTSISMTGTNPSDFLISQTCGTSIAAGGSCPISISFKATATGTRTATLSVVTSVGTVTASVIGTAVLGPKAVLSPTSLAFGSETVGVASAAKAITLSNTGGNTMTISSYAFSGTNSGDFTETTTCVSPLAAGANCTINVVFKPAAAGARTGTLTVNTSGGNVSATLTGTGVAATTAPRVALTSMANPMPANSTLMLTAAVTGSSATKPTGSVELMEGTKVWAEGTLSAGAVTFKLSGMTAGVHLLDAVYLGDAKNAAMTSAVLRQVVGAVTVTNPVARPGAGVASSSVAPAAPR